MRNNQNKTNFILAVIFIGLGFSCFPGLTFAQISPLNPGTVGDPALMAPGQTEAPLPPAGNSLVPSINVVPDSANPLGGEDMDNPLRRTIGVTPAPDVDSKVAAIMEISLSLLGILFLIIMIFGGYKWMAADGEDYAVKRAQRLVRQSIIGLILIVISYGIWLVVDKFLL
jgi:hypothetical protein